MFVCLFVYGTNYADISSNQIPFLSFSSLFSDRFFFFKKREELQFK